MSKCLLVYDGFPLSVQVEHVKPSRRAELLPPEGTARYCILPAVGEGEQPLICIIQRGGISLFIHLLLVKHTVV